MVAAVEIQDYHLRLPAPASALSPNESPQHPLHVMHMSVKVLATTKFLLRSEFIFFFFLKTNFYSGIQALGQDRSVYTN